MVQLVKPGYLKNAPIIAAVIEEGGGGAPPFPVNAVNFDGTNDNLDRGGDLTGSVDGVNLLLSTWFNMLGGDGVAQYMYDQENSHIILLRESTNKLKFRIRSPVPTTLWEIITDALYTTVANVGWHHALIALELDASPVAQIYIDDGAAPVTVLETLIAGTIDWTEIDHNIGATHIPSLRLNGDLSEFYLTNEYLDISIEANRRKFISAAGKPVDLGADGSTPTGTAAKVFLSGDTVSWHTNKGTGGGFTEVGALTDAATSPSD